LTLIVTLFSAILTFPLNFVSFQTVKKRAFHLKKKKKREDETTNQQEKEKEKEKEKRRRRER